MKAKDLRIGNYIYDNQVGHKGSFQVSANGILEIKQGGIKIDYTPNRLTEEWLIKFGKNDLGLKICSSDYPQCDLYIDFNDDGNNCRLRNCSEGFIIGQELKYVHQLQNLYFALTGQELELKTK